MPDREAIRHGRQSASRDTLRRNLRPEIPDSAGGPGGSRTLTAFAAVLQTVGLATCPLPTHAYTPEGKRSSYGTAMRGRTGLYVLAVLIGINFLNYLDRYLPAAAAPAIQDEFHLSDGELGLLGTAFLLVYAVASVPLGLWADRSARRAVIGTGVAIWSVATLFTGFARSFPQLLLTRGVLGIGEASYFPAGTSLLSDLFDKNVRGRTMAFRDAGSVFVSPSVTSAAGSSPSVSAGAKRSSTRRCPACCSPCSPSPCRSHHVVRPKRAAP